MSFYLFAWIASILYALYAITAKLIGKYQLKNVAQFSFFSLLFGGLAIAVVSLLNGAALPSSWTLVVLAGFFLALGSVMYIASLKVLDVSVLTPLFNIRAVITVILGWAFLGETLTMQNALIVALVVAAGIFATMDEKFSPRSFFTKSIAVGLVYMLVLSVQSVLVNRAIIQTDYWTTTLWMGLLAIVFSFVFLYPRFKEDFVRSKPRDYIGVLVLSLLGAGGDLAAYKAFEGNVGVSSVIISLPISMVFAFLLSVWKPSLLEKHTLKVYVIRFSAAAIMIWGALKLST